MLRSVLTFVKSLRRTCFLVMNFKETNYRRALASGHFHVISIQGRTPRRLSARTWVTARSCVSAGLKTRFLVLMLTFC